MEEKSIVDYVSGLARIEVDSRERLFLSGQLSRILEYVEILKKCDVSGVEPLRALNSNGAFLREDSRRLSCEREAILRNSPLREDGYFKIPKVLE